MIIGTKAYIFVLQVGAGTIVFKVPFWRAGEITHFSFNDIVAGQGRAPSFLKAM